jgi:hypothetical protein
MYLFSPLLCRFDAVSRQQETSPQFVMCISAAESMMHEVYRLRYVACSGCMGSYGVVVPVFSTFELFLHVVEIGD